MNEYAQTIKATKIALPAVVGLSVSKNISQLKSEYQSELTQSDSLISKYLAKPGIIDDTGMVKVAGCSGFFVTSDGYILTNRHVVCDAQAEYQMVWRDQKYPIRILTMDEKSDIAVLKCEIKNVPYLKLADSDKLELGQTVLAIGNALGEFQNTVSRGIVSGLSRELKTDDQEENNQKFYGMIQTDAAINPGNSGGPLIDLFGRAIGINAVTVLDVENIGFAIPINQTKTILKELLKGNW